MFRYTVKNPVPVNILMCLILLGGGYYAYTLVRELFPETAPQIITITTLYKGSSPEEVEKGITVKIEDKVKGMEGVESLFSTSSEIGSVVTLRLQEGYKYVDRLLNNVKGEVDKVMGLPKDSEKPQITLRRPLLPVIAFSIYGNTSLDRLRKLGIQARDEVQVIPGITNVEMTGVPNPEIAVEVSPENLLRYQTSFQEIYQTIARSNQDLAGGKLRSPEDEVLVRTLGEVYTAKELQNCIFRHTANGGAILLRDVARVEEAFEADSQIRRFNGQPSVNILIFKNSDQDAIEISKKIKDYVEKFKKDLPSDLKISVHSDLSKYINQRLDLLERNGLSGLILVFLSLLVFMNFILSFWVVMGLIAGFLGTFIMMYLMGVTLNLMSMFGLIVVLGMLVDDGIIIGENIYRHIEEGKDNETAAIAGVSEVAIPVGSAILTTIAAFLPLLMMEGAMGQFMRVLPMVVTAALTISLMESLIILPSHLNESLDAKKIQHDLKLQKGEIPLDGLPLWKRLRIKQLYYLNIMGNNILKATLKKALAYRYAMVFGLVCLTIIFIAIGSVLVPFVIIQKMDADTIALNVNMPVGTPMEKTKEYMSKVEAIFQAVPEKRHLSTLLGLQVAFNTQGFELTGLTGDRAQVFIELKEPGERKRSSFDIMREIREKLDRLPGPESTKFIAMDGGPAGQDIEIELQGQDFKILKKLSEELKSQLRKFDGVHDVGDNFNLGKKEIQISLKDTARSLGLTVEDVAVQVRGAFYGLEADRFYRGKEEIKVMVRYEEGFRQGVWNLEEMRISTPQGGMVFLKDIAEIKIGRSLQSIERTDQKRTITVYADIDYEKNTPQKVTAALEKKIPLMLSQYPGVNLRFKGAKLEAQKSIQSLTIAFIFSMLLIYSILASQFGSYVHPFVVMFAIPFGIVGAIFGHIVMGYVMTVLSLVGIVALSGIVVNDSLVLVDFIRQKREEGMPLEEALLSASQLRLRAILLTSITTILGLAPLMMETSMQAKFLIPMAISLTFGLAFSTVLTLVVIPCLYMIVEDIRELLRKLFRFLFVS